MNVGLVVGFLAIFVVGFVVCFVVFVVGLLLLFGDFV